MARRLGKEVAWGITIWADDRGAVNHSVLEPTDTNGEGMSQSQSRQGACAALEIAHVGQGRGQESLIPCRELPFIANCATTLRRHPY